MVSSSLYRFVGSECFVCTDPKTNKGVKFEAFGQSAVLPDDIARNAVLNGNAALVPDAEFPKNITAEDLKRYGSVRGREGAPEAFLAKLRAAWAALAVYKASLTAQPSQAEAPAQTAEEEHGS